MAPWSSSPPGSTGSEPSTFGSGANTHSGNKHEIVAGHAMAICQAAGLSLCARAFLPKLVNKLWSFKTMTPKTHLTKRDKTEGVKIKNMDFNPL
jgi:hypothetical protein